MHRPSEGETARAGDVVHFERVRRYQKHLGADVLDAVVLVNPHGAHFDRVFQAVNIVNLAQSYYRLKLELDEDSKILTLDDHKKSTRPIRNKIRKAWPNQLVIAMTEQELKGNITISEESGCTIISCDDSDGDDDAPAMRVYLVYQITSALITFAGCLSRAENEGLMHGEDDGDESVPCGCLFDYWIDSEMLFLSMVGARLCDRCRSLLLTHGTPEPAIAATEKLLDWIRSVILGRERTLPQKVFIGHGRDCDWITLRDMLTDWELTIEEFNEEPVAGISISQRLKVMLEQSRFAFLLLTGEDKDNKGRLQARMNVIHEIGLFQGRLGAEYAAVLHRKDSRLFSNLDGINRLDYEPGKLSGLRDEIRRLLIARGVMPADRGQIESQQGQVML